MSNAQWYAQRNAARAEDVLWMVETGENLTGAAKRLGIKPTALDQWCRRHGLVAQVDILRAREPYDWNEPMGREARRQGGRTLAQRRAS